MTKQIKTLKDLKAVAPAFGPGAVEWADWQIANSSLGEDTEVLADDTQIMFILLESAQKEDIKAGKPV